MMELSDLKTLQEMQREINLLSKEALGQAATRLLRLRDGLNFVDAVWYHEFTQNVATLDSASTFHPATKMDEDQLNAAVEQAISRIKQLVLTKLS